jgi:hypothetical protein
MGRGLAGEIPAKGRDVLAEWGAKTAYTLIAAQKGLEEAVPERHRYHLRTNGEPVENVWVGYGAWSGPVNKNVTNFEVGGSNGEQVGYRATFTFACVALFVFGVEPLLPGDAFDTLSDVAVVWPRRQRPLQWPPPFAYTMRSLPAVDEFVPLTGTRPVTP